MVGRNILDHLGASEYEWLVPGSCELNLLNYAEVEKYMNLHRPDVVIHSAGRVGGIQANIREPVRFFVENMDMGRNVLLSAAEAGVKHLINFGSTCMYPKNRQNALSEDEILTGALEPTNEGYALAKISTARLCDYLHKEDPSLQYKTIIPSNLYGRYDKFDPQSSHMIPAVIHKLHIAKLSNAESVEIWGTGEARREFLYAGDLADAVMLALKDFNSLPYSVNIGLGHDFTVNQYYEIAAKVIGYEGKFHHDYSKPAGMDRKLSDIRRGMEWGWKPRHSLEQGIEKTYQYYLQQTNES